jgi:DNA-3-methyladenine glycosylase II
LFRPFLENEIFLPKKSRNIIMSLVWSILSQQLSIKDAKVMHQRFLDIFNGKFPQLEEILPRPQAEIKGVGRWTVEMLLIFGLGREDVFALDDLGIQKGMLELFDLHDLDKKELRFKMEELSHRWSPYRSYVCLYMWKFSGFK